MKGTITVLCDNLVMGRVDTIGEHGFSAFIESDEGNYLFDSGRGFSILQNSIYYRKDLSSVKKILISHGHFDHTGGLPSVLKVVSRELEVVAHPDIFLHRFRLTDNKENYNGMPFTRGYLEKYGAKFSLHREWIQVSDKMFLTGEIPRITSFEYADASERFAVVDGVTIPDMTLDDQAAVLLSDQGLTVILGCAHSGVVNTLSYIVEQTGVDDIYCVIGGTHLGLLPPAQSKKSIEALKNFRIKKLCPGHCTGIEVCFELRQLFPEQFVFCGVGTVIPF